MRNKGIEFPTFEKHNGLYIDPSHYAWGNKKLNTYRNSIFKYRWKINITHILDFFRRLLRISRISVTEIIYLKKKIFKIVLFSIFYIFVSLIFIHIMMYMEIFIIRRIFISYPALGSTGSVCIPI